MLPTLPENRLIIGTGFYKELSKDDLIIFEHQGLDKIKRIKDLRKDEFYVLGDNEIGSTDSRSFGWLPIGAIKAKVIWPAITKRPEL
jgi:type IV secretory pathway protease TraF